MRAAVLLVLLAWGCVPDRSFKTLPDEVADAIGPDTGADQGDAAVETPDANRPEPDVAEPDAELDAGDPDGATPDTAVPDTGPDAAQPDGATPDGAVPDGGPDAADLDAAEPDAAEPDAAEPDAAEPDAFVPDASPDIVILPPPDFTDGGFCPPPTRPADPRPPRAFHPEQAGAVGQPIELHGGFSSGRGGNVDPEFFDWRLVGRPDGSAAALVDPDQLIATLTPDVAGTYRIRLVVGYDELRSEPFEFDVRAVEQIAMEVSTLRTTFSREAILLSNGGTFVVQVNERFNIPENEFMNLSLESAGVEIDEIRRGRSTGDFTYGITPRFLRGFPMDLAIGDALSYDLTLTGRSTMTTDTFSPRFEIARATPRDPEAPVLDEVIIEPEMRLDAPVLLQVRVRGHAIAPNAVLVYVGGVSRPPECGTAIVDGNGRRAYGARDDGTAGDPVANDGIYTLQMMPRTNEQPVCDYEVAVQAADCDDRRSNVITKRFRLLTP